MTKQDRNTLPELVNPEGVQTQKARKRKAGGGAETRKSHPCARLDSE